MSMGDEFQVWLPSDVKGNAKNKPTQYETTLARPLELPGTWEVALMDVSYPHNWINLDKECVVAVTVSIQPNEEIEQVNINSDFKWLDFRTAMLSYEAPAGSVMVPVLGQGNEIEMQEQSRFKRLMRTTGRGYYLKYLFTVVPGQYDILNLTAYLQAEIRKTGKGLEHVLVSFDQATERVSISNAQRNFFLCTLKESSILRILGYAKQLGTTDGVFRDVDRSIVENTKVPLVDYSFFAARGNKIAKHVPQMKPVSGLYVYSDIIDHVLIGDTQAPLLGYFPVLSKFGDTAYWCFNPAYYIRVKDTNIRTIGIKLCNNAGDLVEFQDGLVTCRLHFRRVGFLRGI